MKVALKYDTKIEGLAFTREIMRSLTIYPAVLCLNFAMWGYEAQSHFLNGIRFYLFEAIRITNEAK